MENIGIYEGCNESDNEATNKWLRDCEKAIAKELNMSEAWIHISINGDFLCSL